jgi:predicted DNA repair protein MutK
VKAAGVVMDDVAVTPLLILTQAAVLAAVGTGITAAVYAW